MVCFQNNKQRITNSSYTPIKSLARLVSILRGETGENPLQSLSEQSQVHAPLQTHLWQQSLARERYFDIPSDSLYAMASGVKIQKSHLIDGSKVSMVETPSRAYVERPAWSPLRRRLPPCPCPLGKLSQKQCESCPALKSTCYLG